MPTSTKIAAVLALGIAAFAGVAAAQAKTVCTITVNSSDEREALRRRLPKGEYQFVELLEKGNPDWMRSACRRNVRCDALVISGHFNAGEDFYSDKIDASDFLSMDDLEREHCSDSCPAIFAHLKEVYLFGCESLNPDATHYSSSYGESGRERMRRLFAGVPVIYGFSSHAPVGPTAAMLLNRYFDSAGRGEIASGRPSARLLSAFGRNSMVAVSGVRDADSRAAFRREVCHFYDDRLTPARKLAFVHAMMKRDMGEARTFFERIEKMLAGMTEAERQAPDFTAELAQISADDATRSRYLAMEREAPDAGLRARMIEVATTLGWLSPRQRAGELVAMVNDMLASRSMGFTEVDLVCTLNANHELDGELAQVKADPARAGRTAQAAALACLGSKEAHLQVLAALAGGDDRDMQVVQTYLRHRPISDPQELKRVARGIVRMPSGAQVRALDALGRLNISDREVLEELTRTFASARSASVQRAIAEVFLRSDPKAIPRAELAAVLRQYRLRAGGGHDLIDVLLSRLQ